MILQDSILGSSSGKRYLSILYCTSFFLCCCFLVAIDINDEVWTDSDDVGSSDDSDHNESPPGSQQEASLNPVEVSSNVLVRWMLAFFYKHNFIFQIEY